MNYDGHEIDEFYYLQEQKNIALMATCWWAIRLFYHVLAWVAIYRLVVT